MKRELLRLEGVMLEKENGLYLHNLSLWIAKGEILGLLSTGEHGLCQLLSLIQENSRIKHGRMWFDGEVVNDYIQQKKTKNSVCIIDSTSRMVPNLTIYDNIFVLSKGYVKYVIHKKALRVKAQKIFDELKIPLQAETLAEELSAYERCVVELIKSVVEETKLIILRGLSEILSRSELDEFYKLIRHFKEKGMTFFYLGHHHEEVFQISDRTVLFENGEIIKNLYKDQMTMKNISFYVGAIRKSKGTPNASALPILEFDNVTRGALYGLSFKAYSGSCITILDEDHSLPEDFLGLCSEQLLENEGKIKFKNHFLDSRKRAREFQQRVQLINENPLRTMLFQDQSYMYNLSFTVEKKMKKSIIPRKIMESIKREWKEQLGVYMAEANLHGIPTKDLYTLIYYRVILYNPDVVFLIQPFSGIDMYLRLHIAELIMKLKEKNIAVVILASHIADVLAVTDEILVLKKGCQMEAQEALESRVIQGNYYRDRFLSIQKEVESESI